MKKKSLMLMAFMMALPHAHAVTYEAVKDVYKYDQYPEYVALLSELKTHGEFEEKVISEETTIAPKKMSRGEQMVEEAKARNRALIAQQNATEKKQNENLNQLSELDRMKLEDQQIREGWKKQVLDQRKQWQREQEIFLGRLKVYKENTFVVPAPVVKIVEKKLASKLPSVYIVNKAFEITVRDQFNRPTCSAFAGIRAIEILLSQNKIDKDLSEQYFYWSSKPNCQQSPCGEKGSWVNAAYRFSQKSPVVDIPDESNCSYSTDQVEKNETQIPLPNQCHLGQVKVESFEDVLALADVVEKIKNNIPVIMAAKLSENFYRNQGLVTFSDSKKSLDQKMDGHALGHAFLGIGVMELPAKLKAIEGQYCIVIANSWGKGWGAGGYSCLTEKWLTQFRQSAAFVAVKKISLKGR